MIWLHLALAHAKDVDAEGLAALLNETATAIRGPVTVASYGDAYFDVKTALKTKGITVASARTEAEVQRAMAKAGAVCGLWVTAGTASSFSVREVGACGVAPAAPIVAAAPTAPAPAAPAAPTPAAPAAPTPAAPTAPAPAAVGPAAPAPVASPSPAPAEPVAPAPASAASRDDRAALLRYRDEHLSVDHHVSPTVGSLLRVVRDESWAGGTQRWGVYQGGVPLAPVQFAELVKDATTAADLRRREGTARTLFGAAIAGAVVGIVATSVAPLLPPEGGAPLALAAVGGVGMGVGIGTGIGYAHTWRRVNRYERNWIPSKAAQHVRGHNDALQRSLLLSDEGAFGVELAD